MLCRAVHLHLLVKQHVHVYPGSASVPLFSLRLATLWRVQIPRKKYCKLQKKQCRKLLPPTSFMK